MSIIDDKQIKEDFQRAFKYSRFEEQKTFEEARVDVINEVRALHGGSIHDHFKRVKVVWKGRGRLWRRVFSFTDRTMDDTIKPHTMRMRHAKRNRVSVT